MEAAMKEYFSHISPEELADEAGGPENERLKNNRFILYEACVRKYNR